MIELIECIAASFYSLLAGFAKIYHINPFMLTSNFGTETLYILESFHQKKTNLLHFEILSSRKISIFKWYNVEFRKGYGTQHCLLLMLEIWKGATDNNKAFGALLTDLSKAFDCLSHDLLIAKLHAYGIDIHSLNILQDYLSNRK